MTYTIIHNPSTGEIWEAQESLGNGFIRHISPTSPRWAEVETWAAAQVPPISLADKAPDPVALWEQIDAQVAPLLAEAVDAQRNPTLTPEQGALWQQYEVALRTLRQRFAAPGDVVWPTTPSQAQLAQAKVAANRPQIKYNIDKWRK